MRIAVITMQKDEDILLDKWLSYHGSLFGHQNLFVFDNGSTSNVTKKRLSNAIAAGVNVNFDFSQPKDFENKGKIVAECMQELKDQYDFFVPIDTDEFLDMPSERPLCRSRDDFFAEFSRMLLDHDHQYFRISVCFNNLAHTTRVRRGTTRKLIVKSGTAFKLDGGFHLYDWTRKIDTTPDGKVGHCNFAHIHFHNRDYESLLASAREKLKLRIAKFRGHTLDNYMGNGRHVAPYFSLNPAAYGAGSHAGTTDIKSEWEALGLGDVPYSSSKEITQDVLDKLLDPVNLYYIQQKSDYTIDELGLIKNYISGKKYLLQYGAGSTSLLACELGMKMIRVIEPSVDLINQYVSDKDYQAYVHLGRLSFINDFSVDLRMKNAVKHHVPQDEFDDYLQHVHTDHRYDAVILSGSLKNAVAAKLYERYDDRGDDHQTVIYVCDDESQLRQLDGLFEVHTRVGKVALISPVAGGRVVARSLLNSVRAEYVRRPNGPACPSRSEAKAPALGQAATVTGAAGR
jgi:hypothetical protein